MSRGAHFNRNNRRSGGERHTRIVVGAPTGQPSVAIQCFEGRHRDCTGVDTLMGGSKCECSCHSPRPTTDGE